MILIAALLGTVCALLSMIYVHVGLTNRGRRSTFVVLVTVLPLMVTVAYAGASVMALWARV